MLNATLVKMPKAVTDPCKYPTGLSSRFQVDPLLPDVEFGGDAI